MKHLFTILLALYYSSPSFACINVASYVLKNGHLLYVDREGDVPYGHTFHKEDYPAIIRELDSLYRTTKDIDYLSDKGLLLLLLEQYENAIQLYLHIEKMTPGRYATASNLGTAYELSGQNTLALQWIRTAVAIITFKIIIIPNNQPATLKAPIP